MSLFISCINKQTNACCISRTFLLTPSPRAWLLHQNPQCWARLAQPTEHSSDHLSVTYPSGSSASFLQDREVVAKMLLCVDWWPQSPLRWEYQQTRLVETLAVSPTSKYDNKKNKFVPGVLLNTKFITKLLQLILYDYVLLYCYLSMQHRPSINNLNYFSSAINFLCKAVEQMNCLH